MRRPITYGLAVGLATSAWMYAEFALGLHEPQSNGQWTGFLALVFPIAGAYLLVRPSQTPTWLAATSQGLVFGVAGGLAGALGIYLYFAYTNPGFSVGGTAADPLRQALSAVVASVFVGTLLVLFMRALAIRREAHERDV